MTRISCTETGPEHGNFRGAAPAASGNKGACGGHDNTTLVSQQGKGQWRLIALELVPTAAQRLPAQVSAANRKSNGNKAPNSAGSVDQVKQRAQRRLRRALDFKVRQLARDRSRKAAQRQSDSAAFPARKQAQSTAIFVEPGAAPAASGEQRHMRGVAHQAHVPPKTGLKSRLLSS